MSNPKLKSIRVRGYRCLKDVTLELGDLTVLVGPNGAGKSALLAALNPAMGPQFRDVWQGNPNSDIHFAFSFDQAGTDYVHYKLGPGTSSVDGVSPRLSSFKCQTLKLELPRLRTSQVAAYKRLLSRGGDELVNVFASQTRTNQIEIARRFCGLVPTFRDVDARIHESVGDGMHVLLFQDRWNPNVWYTPDQVSDGSLLVLAFVVLPFQHATANILTIEEPEVGLHPYLIEKVVEMLRMLAKGELGTPPIQIVISTHSPTLVSFLQPEEIRLVSRSQVDGTTSVHRAPTDSQDWSKMFEAFDNDLGSAWLSGALGFGTSN